MKSILTTNYLKSVRRIGADAIVSKNISAVNEVLNVIRSNEDNVEIHRFDDVGVEAIDVIVDELFILNSIISSYFSNTRIRVLLKIPFL